MRTLHSKMKIMFNVSDCILFVPKVYNFRCAMDGESSVRCAMDGESSVRCAMDGESSSLRSNFAIPLEDCIPTMTDPKEKLSFAIQWPVT
jgi:hypothetical protein